MSRSHRHARRRASAPAFRPMRTRSRTRNVNFADCDLDRAAARSRKLAGASAGPALSRGGARARVRQGDLQDQSELPVLPQMGRLAATPAMAGSHFRCARPRSRRSSSPKWSNAAGPAPACLITISSPIRTSAATASRARSSARTCRCWANPCSRARSTPWSSICYAKAVGRGPATYEDCVDFWGQDTRQCEPMKK